MLGTFYWVFPIYLRLFLDIFNILNNIDTVFVNMVFLLCNEN